MSNGALNDGPILLIGGGGFLGRHVAQHLLSRGLRVRIAQRRPGQAQPVRALGGPGQTQLAVADITDAQSIRRVMTGASGVVNLVGLLKGNMQAAHVTGARIVAEAASALGIASLVQVSAIGADPASPSAYGRTKGEGEAAVLSAFPTATILRPSIIFGRDDQFTNRFAGLISALPVVPLIRGAARFQPVFAGDVAEAVAQTLLAPAQHGGRLYELGGPDQISMAEINRWLAHAIGRDRTFLPVPDGIAGLMATLTGWAPGAPITRDQFLMLGADNVVSPGALGFAELGLHPSPLQAVAPGWLTRYRPHGRFGRPAAG